MTRKRNEIPVNNFSFDETNDSYNSEDIQLLREEMINALEEVYNSINNLTDAVNRSTKAINRLTKEVQDIKHQINNDMKPDLTNITDRDLRKLAELLF